MQRSNRSAGRPAFATGVTTAIVAALLATMVSPAGARQRVLQLNEDDSTTRALPADAGRSVLTGAGTSRVCEPGAKWVRLGFRTLVLQSYDSLVVTSSGGDRYVFQGKAWNDRSFSTRAFRGDCVDIQPYFASRDSHYQLSEITSGRQPLAAASSRSRKTAAPVAGVASVVVAGAGDICDTTITSCQATSDLIVSINPTAVYTAGDNAYTNGTLSEYNARYDKTWGRFKTLTNPSPGNHDYNTSGATGYFDYFTGQLTGTGADRSKGYYSWDVGDWHFVSLNTMSGGSVATAQVTWLKSDLAASTKPCTAAYFHHPLISEGNYAPGAGSTYSYSTVKPLYDALYAAKADLVLVGHDHNYQRYAKMNPSLTAASDGFRQVLVGTGGRLFYSMSGTHPLLEKSNANTYGVLKLTLTSTGYTGDFVPAPGGGGFTDQFSGTCNAKSGGSTNTPPTANFSFTSNGLTASFTDGSTDSDGTIASRSWDFGDGTTSTATNPGHTYATAGTYTVKLTVTDNAGATNTVSKAVTVSGGGACGGTVLCSGVAVALPAVATGGVSSNYTLVVPAGKTSVTIAISGGTGDADLYVKLGSAPTSTVYDCRPYKTGNAESCTFTPPSAGGTYYVNVRAYAAYSGVSLKGTTSP